MNDHHLQVVASIGTRLAVGAYPLAFIVAFGWVYGKQAFDIAAAAINWANYLNVFLLSGFALVPPAVARLRARDPDADVNRGVVRDHIALKRGLLVAAMATLLVLWLTIELAFPAHAAAAGARLAIWYVLFAALTVSQIPLTLWLGMAQATGGYMTAFFWTVVPRALALLSLLLLAHVDASPTAGIAVAVVVVLLGQFALARVTRNVVSELDPLVLRLPGRASNVLGANLSAGVIALVGMLVTIVPVTIIGRLLPTDVGLAHVAVTTSNAVGAMIVSAFFPASLTLATRAQNRRAIWRHCARVARHVLLLTAAVIVLGWLTFPLCRRLGAWCDASFYALFSLVIAGAGLRLAALGTYHGALVQGRPHIVLPSAIAEAITVVSIMLALIPVWQLQTLGVAFVAGGALRAAVSLGIEVRWMR